MEKLSHEFIQRMQHQLGAEAQEFFHALSLPPPTSIRLNHLKGKTSFTELENVPWCDEGFYLETRPHFHLDPHWHGGAYYVQEASSMILDEVLNQIIIEEKPRTWLDMCAAPGGKTGILASHMRNGDVLLANEVISQRRAILRENLYKAGYLNVFISGEPSSSFKEPFADIILIDAPCAGEGMMRKEPEAIRQWSPKLVEECSLMQKRIVTDAARAIKPGGYLIYSTCSYSQSENIENVKSFTASQQLVSLQLEFPKEWNITILNSDGVTGYQLYPHKVKGEGFFFAVLKNVDNNDAPEFGKSKKQISNFIRLPEWLEENLNGPERFMIRKDDEQNSLITADAEVKANELLRQFPKSVLTSESGELKGKDFIPSHFLAMSNLFSDQQEKIDLSLDQSLDYLERSTNIPPSERPSGWYLITFQGTTLGWAKLTSQGWKNHYPLHWRLRSRKIS